MRQCPHGQLNLRLPPHLLAESLPAPLPQHAQPHHSTSSLVDIVWPSAYERGVWVRIAYVTETWVPAVDGVVTRLRATLAEVQRAGHEVLVIAPRQPGMHAAGVRVVGVPTIGFRFVYGGKRWGLPTIEVARQLRYFAPDVVHVLNPVLVGSAGVLAAWRQRRTLVVSHHTDLAHYAAHYHLGWTVPVLRALQRRLHGAAHLNLATSTTAARELAAQGIAGAAVWPRGWISTSSTPSLAQWARGGSRSHCMSVASPPKKAFTGSYPYPP